MPVGPKKAISKKGRNPSVLEALGISLKFGGESKTGVQVVSSDRRVQMINEHNKTRDSKTPVKPVHDASVIRLHDFHRACRQGIQVDVEFMATEFPDLLKQPSKDSEDSIGTGGACLHYAVLGDQSGALQYLITRGAVVNARSERGVTPLHLACSRGLLDCATVLIDHGASMNEKDNFGNTPFGILMTHSGDRAIGGGRKSILSYYNRSKNSGNMLLGGTSRSLLELTDKILYRNN